MKNIAVIVLALFVFSCQQSSKNASANPEDEYRVGMQDVKLSDDEIARMKIIVTAQQAIDMGKMEEAKSQLNDLVSKSPDTKEGGIAKRMLAEIELRKKNTENAPVNFPDMPATSTVSVMSSSLTFNKLSFSDRWEFDRYPGKSTVDIAEEGYRYLTAQVAVTTQNHDPRLPPILVYSWHDGECHLIGTMTYAFNKWATKDTYLGNSHDDGNDFAKSPTVQFSPGLAIPTAELGRDLIVMVENAPCIGKKEQQFDNPPVIYSSLGCRTRPSLKIEDLKDRYQIVQIFRGSKN